MNTNLNSQNRWATHPDFTVISNLWAELHTNSKVFIVLFDCPSDVNRESNPVTNDSKIVFAVLHPHKFDGKPPSLIFPPSTGDIITALVIIFCVIGWSLIAIKFGLERNK